MVEGPCLAYIVRDTYTRSILNIHGELHSMRELARVGESKLETPHTGPRVVVVGPPGSGRTTLAMTLVNYGARLNPMLYLDLDVSQNEISLSGMLSCVAVDRPVMPHIGWSSSHVLSFPFGHISPSSNSKLYGHELVQLLKSVESKEEAFPETRASGWIAKAPSFDSAESYQIVLDTIKSLHPHIIVVLGYDRLVHDFTALLSDRMDKKLLHIVNVSRSSGIIYYGANQVENQRQLRIRDYFYGPSRELGPARISLPFGEKFVVVQLKLQDQISITAMPIDQEAPAEAELEVLPITPDRQLKHHILAVSYAHSIEQVLFSNIAGYLHVLDVDMEKSKIVCTSPLERIETGSSGGTIFLINTEFKFTDVE